MNKMAAYFIVGWSSVTIIICIIDLALGILFGIDLGNIEVRDIIQKNIRIYKNMYFL